MRNDERMIDPEDHVGAESVALRILGGAAQSAQQLRRRLVRRGYGAATAADVVTHLQEGGWVDDRGLAAGVAQRRLDRGYGHRRIIADLAARGVEDSVVSATLQDVDAGAEADAVETTARRLRRRLPDGRLDQAQLRRLGASLQRRGFAGGAIRDVLRQIDREDAATAAGFDEDTRES